MEQNQKGSKSYLISIVMVAVLGGLLFGYDTAVISGAEKGLQAFFKSATDFEYTDFMHGFTSSSALIGCIIGSALSGLFASKFGRKRSLIFAGICFFLSAWGSICHLSDVYRRGCPEQHPRHACKLEPVCHHLRTACGIFRQLHHPRFPCQPSL